MADIIVAVDHDNVRLLDHDGVSEAHGANDGPYRDQSDGSSHRDRFGNREVPANQRGEDIVIVDNVHKTYLLGIEGVAALRLEIRWNSNKNVYVFLSPVFFESVF